MTAAADRHLLFGLLALQHGLIDQGALVAASEAWARDETTTLADHLVARGDLGADDRTVLEALVTRQLNRHGGDVDRSLATIQAGKSTRESLARHGDHDIQATLSHLASGHGLTVWPKSTRPSPGSETAWRMATLTSASSSRRPASRRRRRPSNARQSRSDLAGQVGAGVSAAEGEEEAGRAMGLLRRAAASGFRNANAFLAESALASLHDRTDFRVLMMDLAFPADPFARVP
jgi:hypothetical protein